MRRRIARIGGAQADGAGAVLGVRLEDGPGEIVVILGDQLRVARKVAAEVAEQGEGEQIRQRALPAPTA